jgi:soluble lytic murein transglycosylase-like protein
MALPLLAVAGAAQAADVYRSIDADGTARYASQALDPSYTLVYSEPASGEPPAGAHGASAPQPRRSPAHLRPIIDKAARTHGLDPQLVEAVVGVESGFRPGAVSPKGARGPMQLMPGTAADYGLRDARAMHDPERNIDAGARHLKSLLKRYSGNVALALAAYNAGPRAVQRHGERIPPFSETMLYVPAVLSRSAAAQER